MKMNDSLDHFSLQWERWEGAILNYSKASKSKPAHIQRILDSTDEGDPGIVSYLALSLILFTLLYRFCDIECVQMRLVFLGAKAKKEE